MFYKKRRVCLLSLFVLILSNLMFFAIAAQAQEELLTTDQIDEIYVKEKTPGVLEKLTEDQQKEIVIALRNAQEENARKSVVIAEREASRFKDALERSFYEDDVYQNLMLTSRRAIAEKYGIKAGDTSMVEMMYVSRTGIYDPR